MTRRDFLGFFLFGGILSVFRRKIKGAEGPRKAMYWREVDR